MEEWHSSNDCRVPLLIYLQEAGSENSQHKPFSDLIQVVTTWILPAFPNAKCLHLKWRQSCEMRAVCISGSVSLPLHRFPSFKTVKLHSCPNEQDDTFAQDVRCCARVCLSSSHHGISSCSTMDLEKEAFLKWFVFIRNAKSAHTIGGTLENSSFWGLSDPL